MKKNKTALTTIKHADTSSFSSSSFLSQSSAIIDDQIHTLQQKSKQDDTEILLRKNKLLQKQLQLLKQSKQCLQNQLEAYRKVVLNKGDLHQILQLQHSQIFQLQTNLQVLQGKYDKLLSRSGSGMETQYAIKCKQLQNTLRNRQIEHQKEVAALKGKLMKMSVSEIYENNNNSSNMGNSNYGNSYDGSGGRLYSGNSTTINNSNSKQLANTPVKNSRRLV